MRIAILEADHVAEELVMIYGDYASMFKRMLSKVDASLEYDVYSVIDGEFPQDINAADGYLITGSKFGAYDKAPWIDQLGQLIVNLYEHKKPLVGICFGHQLIAEVLGGRTEKAPQGWGVGLSTSRLLKIPGWMRSIPDDLCFSLLVSHQDQVVELPKGADLLGGNDFCKHGMYQIEHSILTFQGHPEFNKEYCLALMEKRKAILGEAVYEKGVDSLAKEHEGNLIAKWIVEFMAAAG